MNEQLLDSIRKDRAPHAVLLTGPEGSGKRELARRAAALYCLGEDAPERLGGCPNYCEVGERAVGVEDVRDMLGKTRMMGFNGGRSAFVLVNAHRMSAQIQNTLLKTLEEPRGDTLLLLTGSEIGLLPTIRSRCVTLRLGAEKRETVCHELVREGVDTEQARLFAALSDGIMGRARAFADADYAPFRSEALSLMEQAMFSHAPFARINEMVTVYAEDDDALAHDEGAQGKSQRKRKRGDLTLTLQILGIWESVARDALMQAVGAGDMRNSDAQALVKRMASRFTIARMRGIIELLAKAQQNAISGASVYMTMDTVLAGLYDKESR